MDLEFNKETLTRVNYHRGFPEFLKLRHHVISLFSAIEKPKISQKREVSSPPLHSIDRDVHDLTSRGELIELSFVLRPPNACRGNISPSSSIFLSLALLGLSKGPTATSIVTIKFEKQCCYLSQNVRPPLKLDDLALGNTRCNVKTPNTLRQ
jgi:hypothetical protein